MNIPRSPNLLLIFTRNPVAGQCKTRLAATIGNEAALEVYLFLLKHTAKIAREVDADKWVCYSDGIGRNDLWDEGIFEKKLQRGNSLGERMEQAFREGFNAGYRRICIIGSDLYDLQSWEVDKAFRHLEHSEAVIGPAQDGGYYLLGMKAPIPGIFDNKGWGGDRVFESTTRDLRDLTYTVLPVRNDVDYYEDIRDVDAFRPFLSDLDL